MNNNDECSICLDLIKEYDYVILSCKHMFHYKCLETWLQTKKEYIKLCPLCDTPGEVENIITINKYGNNQNKQINKISNFYLEETYEPVCCCNIL